ncbi:MAG: alpha/beta fold hydrolase [Oscillospiraceae bacterium]|jgi:hypothetical protein|nr:alpha/beta fold hydrolase [Oscillospiraceae bacterium]
MKTKAHRFIVVSTLIAVLCLAFSFALPASQVLAENDIPIIIIPGVVGTRLYSDPTLRHLIWAPKDEGTVISSLPDIITKDWDADIRVQFINKLGQIAGLISQDTGFGFLGVDGSALDITKTVYFPFRKVDQKKQAPGLREYGAKNTYKFLVDELCASTGERPVYFFSYDWRQSNYETAKELRNFIINELGVTSVDLVCHSMGGLVASNYAAEYGTDAINKIVTLATPYEGAPQLINAVLNWDFLNFGMWTESAVIDNITNTFGDAFLGTWGLQKRVKASWPGVAELSPTQEYVRQTDFFVDRDVAFIDYATKITLEQYNQYCNIIFSNFAQTRSTQSNIRANGVNVLASYENAYFGVGIGLPTMNTVIFKDGETLEEIDSLSNANWLETLIGSGDGTVPYQSATMMGYLKLQAMPGHYEEFVGFNHGEMGGDSKDADKAKRITEWVIGILAPITDLRAAAISPTQLTLEWSNPIPTECNVYFKSGNTSGFVLISTTTDSSVNLVNLIPEASYEFAVGTPSMPENEYLKVSVTMPKAAAAVTPVPIETPTINNKYIYTTWFHTNSFEDSYDYISFTSSTDFYSWMQYAGETNISKNKGNYEIRGNEIYLYSFDGSKPGAPNGLYAKLVDNGKYMRYAVYYYDSQMNRYQFDEPYGIYFNIDDENINDYAGELGIGDFD